MDYSFPFILDKKGDSMESWPEHHCMAESLRLICSVVKEGTLGLSEKDTLESMGFIYIPLYFSEYNESGHSFIFTDNVLMNEGELYLPLLFSDNMTNLREQIEAEIGHDDLSTSINYIASLMDKIERERHFVSFTLARKDIVDEISFYLSCAIKDEKGKFIISNENCQERDKEISNIYQLIQKEQMNLEHIEENIEKIKETISVKTQELIKKMENNRSASYNRYSEQIEPLEKKFNEEIFPDLEAKLQINLLPYQHRIGELRTQYESKIQSLLSEEELRMGPLRMNLVHLNVERQNKIDLINRDYTLRKNSLEEKESFYSSSLNPNNDFAKTLFENNINQLQARKKNCEWALEDAKRDAKTWEGKRYESKEAKEQYEKANNRINRNQSELNDIERDYKATKKNYEVESKNASRQFKQNLSSLQSNMSSIEKEYEQELNNKTRYFDDQIGMISASIDQIKNEYEEKKMHEENIYTNSKNEQERKIAEIQNIYNSKIQEEKSKFEPIKEERENENSIYSKLIENLKKSEANFLDKSSKYLDAANEEMDRLAEFFAVNIENIINENNSKIAKVLVPLLVAEIKDDKGKNRIELIPPLVYENSSVKYIPKNTISLGGMQHMFGNSSSLNGKESYDPSIILSSQGRLHYYLKEVFYKRINENDNIKNVCLSYIKNNSILKSSSIDKKKLLFGVEILNKKKRFSKKEYNKISKIINSNNNL